MSVPKSIPVEQARAEMVDVLTDWVDTVIEFKKANRELANELRDPLTSDERKQELKEEYKERYPRVDFDARLAPRLFLKATQGIGKTRAVCGEGGAFQRLLDRNAGKLLAVTPSHSLAAEFYQMFIQHGDSMQIFHVRGRDQPAVDYDVHKNPIERQTKETMCKTPDLVKAMTDAGVDATKSWCMAEGMCPYARDCDWLRQRDEVKIADVIVATHDSLFTPIIGNPQFDVIFVDEELRDIMPAKWIELPVGVNAGFTTTIDLGALLDDVDSDEARNALRDVGKLQHTLALVFQNNANKGGLLAALRNSAISRKQMRYCVTWLQKYKSILQSRTLSEIARKEIGNPDKLTREGLKELAKLAKTPLASIAAILEIVLLELRNEVEDDCTSLYASKKKGTHGDEYYVGGSRWIMPRITNNTAVLHADGTGNEEIVRETFGSQTKTVEINAKRNLEAMLVRNGDYSKTSLRNKGARGEKKLNEIAMITKQQGFDAVLSHIDVVKRMALIAPDGVWQEAEELDIHFKKLRGLNHYQNRQYLGIFSMPLPPVHAVERKARAIALHRRVKFTGIEHEGEVEYGKDERKYLQRGAKLVDGQGIERTVTVSYHPDPIGELVRYQMCEVEVLQGIDRIRPINATEPKRVALLASAAIKEIEWTYFARHELFKRFGATRVDACLYRYNVVPLMPRLWVTAMEAVNDDLFANVASKYNCADRALRELIVRLGKFVKGKWRHGQYRQIREHPTSHDMYEYLVCADVIRDGQRNLGGVLFLTFADTPHNAFDYVRITIERIDGHTMRKVY